MKDKRLNADYVEDILNAISAIEEYTTNKTYEAFENDKMCHDAVILNIAIIGEACGKISKEIQEKYSEIPWHAIISMRNRLIHGYFGINLYRIWLVVQDDIPEFKSFMSVLKTELENEK